jgi:hypothetical protein
MPEESTSHISFENLNKLAISQPLVQHIYTADPSAHLFAGKLYIYPSHDIDAGAAFDDLGGHFAMEDYHVLSMDSPTDTKATDHGIALHVNDVPWASSQMWAPDAAEKDGKYYLYFPAKKPDGIFQIGVAVSDSPTGPFVPEATPIAGSYSIDPAVFADHDGNHYMYFGGLWGGQLQKYRNNTLLNEEHEPQGTELALGPLVAKLASNMLDLAEPVREIIILDENGQALLAKDNERRFFEASWVHKHNGTYYFSYSTGDTHYICYATGSNPYGPFTYGGRILEPVVGWTSHHSICQYEDRWYLFYHDSSLSHGITHLRSVKVTELFHEADGSIRTIKPYGNLSVLP